ncbi:MAG TPA: hypothetical protein VFU10_09035 [Gaiellaceae bacterium]|nr:hypothetical protein [Gaiellaceae bacterium]
MAGTDPPGLHGYAGWVRALLVAQLMLSLGVGLALYIAPHTSTDVWPWTLTPLTARAVGAGLLGLAVASTWALKEADWERVGGPAISFLAFGILQLIALVRYHDTVSWSDWELWILIALLVSFLAVGAEGVRIRRPAHAAAPVAAD